MPKAESEITESGESQITNQERPDWLTVRAKRDQLLAAVEKVGVKEAVRRIVAPETITLDQALDHLGFVLKILAELSPNDRCRALDEAQLFYNDARPDAKIEPLPGHITRLVQIGPLDWPMKEMVHAENAGRALESVPTRPTDPCNLALGNDEGSPAQSIIREIAYIICPYLIYGDDPGYDLARPQECPLPTCKRCPSTPQAMPGCLLYAEHASRAVAEKLEEMALAQIKRMQDFIVERALSAEYDKWVLSHVSGEN